MIRGLFEEPSADERFYARAFGIMVGPGRRTALVLRLINAVYWLAVLGMIGWLLAQAFYRPLPTSGRTQVLLTPAVRAGEPLKVSYAYWRSKVCASDVYWQETDGSREVHRFGPLHVASPGEVGWADFIYAWPTARTASPGSSRLRVVVEFQCPDNYLEAFYPATEVLDEIDYETLPAIGVATEPPAPGAP